MKKIISMLVIFSLIMVMIPGNILTVSASTIIRTYESNGAYFGHLTGRLDGTDWSASTALDNEQFMIYGPYTTDVPIGHYNAVFTMKTDDITQDNANVVRIDVNDSTSNEIISTTEITRKQFTTAGAYQSFRLPFDQKYSGHSLEFRVFWHDTANITVDKIEVEDNIAASFEVESMYHTIGRAEGAGWSADTTLDNSGFLAYGPYTTAITAGKKVASFLLKIDNNTSDNNAVIKLTVYDATANINLAEEDIYREQFINADTYQYFNIPFTVQNAGNSLEFVIFWYDMAKITADKIVIDDRTLLSYDANSPALGHATGSLNGNEWTADTTLDNAGHMVFGPYVKTLITGKKTASFALKIDNNTSDNNNVVRLDAYDSTAGIVLAEMNITRKQFKNANVYQYFDLNFTAETGGDSLEFRVFWYDNANISFRRSEIYDQTNNLLYFDASAYISATSKCVYPAGSTEYEGRTSPTIYTKYAYDFMGMISAAQGIINRDGAHVYYKWRPYDGHQSEDFWYGQLAQENEFLEDTNRVEVSDFYNDILRPYLNKFSGIVLWDDNVPSTYDVALTVAGADNLLPVRYDTSANSLYTEIINQNLGLSVVIDLSGKFTGSGTIWQTTTASTGSAKCDAYIWAIQKYINTGKVSNDTMAYCIDAYSPSKDSQNNTMYWDKITWCDALDTRPIMNADYFTMKKAFVMDLMMVSGYTPNDDPSQPVGTDLNTLNAIMTAMLAQSGGNTITVCGFAPWNAKYTSRVCTNGIGDVDSEWRLIDVLSHYNAQLDADALNPTVCLNASVLSKTPLDSNLTQSNYGDTSATYNSSKRYITIYMGDYDSSAWVSRCLPYNWTQSERGQIPLAWCINANLAQRVPNVYNYLYETKTANDYFVAGDNGSGYLNPVMLDSSLVNNWQQYNVTNMARFDLSICGFLIPAYTSQTSKYILDIMSLFVPNGIVTPSSYNSVKYTPVSNSGWYDTSSTTDATNFYNQLLTMANNTSAGNFRWVRTVQMQVNVVVDAVNMLKTNNPNLNIEVVDPYTYFRLFKQKNGILNKPNFTDLVYNRSATSNNAPNSAGEAASYALDDGITTHWCTLAAAPNYMTVDMGSVQTINRYMVWHAGSAGESTSYNTKNFKVQVSTDGVNFTDVSTITNNTANYTSRTFTAVNARYVRLYVTAGTQSGSSTVRIAGFEVYYDTTV